MQRKPRVLGSLTLLQPSQKRGRSVHARVALPLPLPRPSQTSTGDAPPPVCGSGQRGGHRAGCLPTVLMATGMLTGPLLPSSSVQFRNVVCGAPQVTGGCRPRGAGRHCSPQSPGPRPWQAPAAPLLPVWAGGSSNQTGARKRSGLPEGREGMTVRPGQARQPCEQVVSAQLTPLTGPRRPSASTAPPDVGGAGASDALPPGEIRTSWNLRPHRRVWHSQRRRRTFPAASTRKNPW